jgi:hypothetical protein
MRCVKIGQSEVKRAALFRGIAQRRVLFDLHGRRSHHRPASNRPQLAQVSGYFATGKRIAAFASVQCFTIGETTPAPLLRQRDASGTSDVTHTSTAETCSVIHSSHRPRLRCRHRARITIDVILVFALRNTHPAQRTNQIVQILRLDKQKSINGIRLSPSLITIFVEDDNSARNQNWKQIF